MRNLTRVIEPDGSSTYEPAQALPLPYEAISTFGWFDGKCKDCGEPVLVNQLAEGTHNNRDNPSRSWCTCADRATNKGKVLAGNTIFCKDIRK